MHSIDQSEPRVINQNNQRHIAGGLSVWAVIVFSLVLCVLGVGSLYLINSDRSVPSGYIHAQNAKVIQDTPVHSCYGSGKRNGCNTSYRITARFSAQNAQSYTYSDTLPNNHQPGSNINLFYNPSDPTHAYFVAEHSNTNAVPIILGSLGFCILLLWVTYFATKQR
jgi:hypothetical protein